MAGAGEGGICYHEWKLFSPRELCQHFSIYIFNGLSPSPRLENKFRPHSENPVHGNDLVYHLYGPNIEQCHQRFTRFLAVQDPGIDIPAKNKYPNWKVRLLLQWMNFLFPLIWVLGVCFAINEMTIGFQGIHANKKGLLTKPREMGFRWMLYAMMASATSSTFATHPQMQSIRRHDFHHYILVSCCYLIQFRISFMCTGWITFIIM